MDLGFGPDERLGVGVVGLDEGIDMRSELFDRGEGSSGMGSSGTSALLPTAVTVRTALDRLSQRLVKVGVKVGRDSPLVPNLAESAQLYMRLLLPAFSANWPPDQYKQAQVAAEALNPDDKSLVAERSRGTVLSHRDWIAADRARVGLQQRWSELFREWDVVLCPPMSTPAFPPRPQNALFGATYRDRWEGVSIFRSIGLAGNCYDAGPSRHSDTDRSFRDWTADRCSDRRALPRGPHNHRFC